MASVKISELIELLTITNDDFIPIVDSGSGTTYRASFSTINDWMEANGSASHANNADTASFVVSASYARSSSWADRSGHAITSTSSSFASSSLTASYVVGIADAEGVYLNRTLTPNNQWMTIWSGSGTTTLQRTAFLDVGPQYNVGKLMYFGALTDGDGALPPMKKVYKEFRTGSVYNQWLTLAYIFSSGSGDDYIGSYAGSSDPDTYPPGGANRNLRFIPKPAGVGQTNILDEQGIGSQQWTQYFRSQRYWAWYLGGSSFGHSNLQLDPGISASAAMVLNGPNLGIGDFRSGSTYFQVPQKALHISGTRDSANSLIRLDTATGSYATLGNPRGWFKINISGSDLNVPLYDLTAPTASVPSYTQMPYMIQGLNIHPYYPPLTTPFQYKIDVKVNAMVVYNTAGSTVQLTNVNEINLRGNNQVDGIAGTYSQNQWYDIYVIYRSDTEAVSTILFPVATPKTSEFVADVIPILTGLGLTVWDFGQLIGSVQDVAGTWVQWYEWGASPMLAYRANHPTVPGFASGLSISHWFGTNPRNIRIKPVVRSIDVGIQVQGFNAGDEVLAENFIADTGEGDVENQAYTVVSTTNLIKVGWAKQSNGWQIGNQTGVAYSAVPTNWALFVYAYQ
jgi:hypothetical protein